MNLNEIQIRTSAGTYYIDPDDLEYSVTKAIEGAYEEGQEDHECDEDWECDEDHDGYSIGEIEDIVEDLKWRIENGTTLADKSVHEVLDELLRTIRRI